MRLLNQSYIVTQFNLGRCYCDCYFGGSKTLFIGYFEDHQTLKREAGDGIQLKTVAMLKLAMNEAHNLWSDAPLIIMCPALT